MSKGHKDNPGFWLLKSHPPNFLSPACVPTRLSEDRGTARSNLHVVALGSVCHGFLVKLAILVRSLPTSSCLCQFFPLCSGLAPKGRA